MSIKTVLRAALAAAALVAAAWAPSAGASVQVGASGWQWGNPLPQGNTLRAMSFAGATGYAVGDFGTLLKTTDGGATWSGLPVGTFGGLTTVQALDASTVFAGGGCVARRSTDGGRSFTAIRFTPVEVACRAGLRDLSFVTGDVGYLLLDDGRVFATEDGGNAFAPRTAVPETRAAGGSAAPAEIAFLDASTGYATSGNQVFQTRNGGGSWRAVGAGPWELARLWFADAQTGFAVGRGGTFLRTDDGGDTWRHHAVSPGGVSPGGPDYTSIACSATRTCLLTTAGGRQIVRTTDMGDTPGSALTPATDPIHAVGFASPTRAVAGGANGATVLSDNAGETFTAVGGGLGGSFGALRVGAVDGTAFALGGDGTFARTTDGGRSWSTGRVLTGATLVDLAFPSASVGYALDGDGGLFRTADGGTAWRTLGTGSARRPLALLAPDTRTVLVVEPIGMRRSTDGGETFEQVRARDVLRARLDGGLVASGGALVAWGRTVLLSSVDGGQRWRRLLLPGRTARERRTLRIAEVSFSSARVGLLRDTAGRVWRTSTAGGRWRLLSAVGTERIAGMVIGAGGSAYLVTDAFGGREGGYLLRTGDRGATWQPQFVVDAPIRAGGIAAGGDVDYLLAGGASLLFSTTGGVAGERSALTLATRARLLPRARRITVTGRLQPAAGGAQVVVSVRTPGSRAWQHQTVTVASNGTFATAWRVPRGATTFVAQWAGDFASAGAGSRTLEVVVDPRRAARRRARRR